MLKKNYKPICNIACVALMLVLLVLQFLPGYWTCQKATPEEDGTYKTESASLQEYMWLPSEFSYFEKYFENAFGKDFILNDAAMMPVVTLVFGVLGILFCLIKYDKAWVALLPALVGGFGTVGYLIFPIYQMNGMWIIHCIVCVLILAVAMVSLVTSLANKIKALRNEIRPKA